MTGSLETVGAGFGVLHILFRVPRRVLGRAPSQATARVPTRVLLLV